jgi:hypothetical protein
VIPFATECNPAIGRAVRFHRSLPPRFFSHRLIDDPGELRIRSALIGAPVARNRTPHHGKHRRRRFLKELLGALAGAAGSVVLASASTSQASAAGSAPEPHPAPSGDIQDRAEQIANAAGTAEEEVVLGEFLNRGFRNGVGGGFRNGGFGNGLGGGFRNGAFRNW